MYDGGVKSLERLQYQDPALQFSKLAAIGFDHSDLAWRLLVAFLHALLQPCQVSFERVETPAKIVPRPPPTVQLLLEFLAAAFVCVDLSPSERAKKRRQSSD